MADNQEVSAPQMVARMALSYPKVKICFVDPDNIAYSFGRGLRISSLGKNAKVPRGIYGVNPWNGDFLWSDTKYQRGFSAFTFNWRMGLAATAPRSMNPVIEVINWNDHTRKFVLTGGLTLEYTGICLSRNGERCAGFGNGSDMKLVVWETPTEEGKKEPKKLVEHALPAPCNFISFDPSDCNLLVTGGENGLFLWRMSMLLDDHVIAVTKFMVPDDKDLDSTVSSTASISEEPDHFEELMNQGKREETEINANWFTAHAWGEGSKIYVANKAGTMYSLQCSKKKGVEVTGVHPLIGAGPSTDPALSHWRAVHLAYTLTHLIVVGSDGISRWLETKKFEEEKLAVAKHGGEVHEIVSADHSPGYDSLVVGTKSGALFITPLMFDKSMQEEKETYGLEVQVVLEAEPMALVQDFGAGKVTGLAVISTSGYESKALLVTSSDAGEIRMWSELSGHVLWSKTLELPEDEVADSDNEETPREEKRDAKRKISRAGGIASARSNKHDDNKDPKKKMVTLPITAMSSVPHMPLLAVGTSTGHVYIFYLNMEPNKDKPTPQVRCLMRVKLFSTSVTHICIHSQMPFVAASSSQDSRVFALELSPQRPFYVCSYTSSPNGKFITSLMWRGYSLLYSDAGGYLNTFNLHVTGGPPNPTPQPPSWRIRLTAPFSSMYSFMCMPTAPFMALCANSPNLQVYAPMPEEAPQKIPKLLESFNSMEAHSKGSLIMSFSPDNTLLATGGLDGSVSLWNFSEHAVHRVDSLQVHSSAVIQIVFSLDSRRIYSTSLDGSVIGVVIDGTAGKELKVSMALSMRADMTLEAAGPRDLPTLAKEPLWAEARTKKLKEAHQMEVDAHKSVQRDNLQELAKRFMGLVHRNATLPEIERLERSEFVIDTEGRDRSLAASKTKAQAMKNALKSTNLAKELVAARIRSECWDSMEEQHQAQELLAFQREGVKVRNFPIAKRTPEETARLGRIRRLRAMELRDIKREKGAAKAWPVLLNEIPAEISWMVNEGVLVPVEDVVEHLKKMEELSKEKRKPGAGKAKAAKAENDEDKDDVEETGAESDDEHYSETVLPDGKSICALLYPPAALRTHRQKRTQMLLLKELIREMKLKFNVHFQKLYSDKEDEMFKIKTLNDRITEILTELQSDEDYFTPEMQQSEIPDHVLKVKEEMKSVPYETEEMREKRRRAELERKRREEEAQGEDIGKRALMDMMNGTLEVKKDTLDLASALKKPTFVDVVPEEDYTQEQRKELEEYEAKVKAFLEEQEKQRKALELELKKLRTEVNDTIKLFDDKVQALATSALRVQEAICTQELFYVRLGVTMVDQEVYSSTIVSLEKQLKGVMEQKQVAAKQISNFNESVESYAMEMQKLQEEDRNIEKNFRKDITETANKPINQDDFKKIIKLFKQRDGSASYDEGGDSSQFGYSSTGYTTSKGQSRSNRESRRTSKMRTSNVRRSQSKRTSRVQSSSRASRGGMSSASQGMGPLQQAMKEAMNKAKKEIKVADDDPFRENDDRLEREKVNEALAASDDVEPLNQENDVPEGFVIEDQVWNKLNEVRTLKVKKERDSAKRKKKYEEMQGQLKQLQDEENMLNKKISMLELEKDELIAKMSLGERNLEVLVRLKQGQDEVEPEAVVTEYADALMIPTDLIKLKNEDILKAGGEKVKILNKIKNFRKSITLMQWQKNYLQEQVKDLEEYFTDLQLLRVTKDLQSIIKGDATETDKKIVERYEVKTQIMTKTHSDRMLKMQTSNAKLLQQIQERQHENERLQSQYEELKNSVAVRQSIHRTRADGGGTALNSSAQVQNRMKRITLRRRLIDLASAQTEETEALRLELDRLRQRTFPSFAHAARTRLAGNPDEYY